MDLARDPVMEVMEEMRAKTVGMSGVRGAVAVFLAEVVNSSGQGSAISQNAMESTGWHVLATLSPVKVNGDVGVIGRRVRYLAVLEHEPVLVNAFLCRVTYFLEMIAKDKALSMTPARCPIAIPSLVGANGVNGLRATRTAKRFEPEDVLYRHQIKRCVRAAIARFASATWK